jgi:cytidylate kinase
MDARRMTSLKPIVAIDGPAGSGKSTIAKIVARKLDLFYIDTGAMYRCIALKAKENNVPATDIAKICAIAKDIDIRMSYDASVGKLTVTMDNRDVTEDIRRPDMTRHVSEIAKIKEVREVMVKLQRKLADGKKAILEGRDTTTVVFPDAYKKFYLDASPEERVKRRYLEMKEKHIPVEKENIENDISSRDHIDKTRAHSPLKLAVDAVFIDTTKMTIEEVAATVIREIQKKP